MQAKAIYEAVIGKYGADQGAKVFNNYCQEHNLDAEPIISVNSGPLTFATDNITSSVIVTKSGKNYYVTGYISTSDLDVQNDIVTPECLRDMVDQIASKNIKLDVEHEAFLQDSATVPIGRIIEAKLDKKGIWVKAELNAHHARFEEVWNSLKNKFLDAFSITFKPVQFVEKNVVGIAETVRMLYKVALLNVAITGNPAQENAKIMEVFTKSVKMADIKSSINLSQMSTSELEDILAGNETAYVSDQERSLIRREIDRRKGNKSVKMTDIKQAEGEKPKDKEMTKEEEEEEAKKKSLASIPSVEVVEKNDLKSLVDAISELKSQMTDVSKVVAEMKKAEEVDKLTAEVKSLSSQLVEVKAKLAKPVFKAIDTTSVVEKKAEESAKITGRGVIGLI